MNIFRFIIPVLLVITGGNLKAQVTFDMDLSETRSNAKIILHTKGNSFADSITVKGYIATRKKGICGDICAGGTIKFELAEKISGYPYSYLYIVSSCVTGKTNKEIIELNVTRYTGKETECYYTDVVDIIDSKGVPYYKISKKETEKTFLK